MKQRDFNQDIAGAKRAAQYNTYRTLLGEEPSLPDLLAHPASNDVDFDPPKLGDELARPAEFS